MSERVHATSAEGGQHAPDGVRVRPAASPEPLTARLLQLQNTAGNRAVQRLVANPPPVQRVIANEGVFDRMQEQRMQEVAALKAQGNVSSLFPQGPAQPPSAPVGRPRSNAITEAPDLTPPAAADATPAPLSLPEKYSGEDKQVGWRAFFGQDTAKLQQEDPAKLARLQQVAQQENVVTKYFSPEEQAKNELKAEAGALTSGGAAANIKKTEYAMDPQGTVVGNLTGSSRKMGTSASGQQQMQNIHHSSMLAGGDVAHAGHIGVDQGKVNYLDDDSGHYRPTEAHTLNAFNTLAGHGVLDPNSQTGRVNLVDKTGEKGVNQGAQASVHFSGYQQAGGNEQGIRNKSAMLGELEARMRARPAPGPAQAPITPSEGGLVFDPNAGQAPTPYQVSPYTPGQYAPSPYSSSAQQPMASATPTDPAPYQVSPDLSPYSTGQSQQTPYSMAGQQPQQPQQMPADTPPAGPPPAPAGGQADGQPSVYSGEYIPFVPGQ